MVPYAHPRFNVFILLVYLKVPEKARKVEHRCKWMAKDNAEHERVNKAKAEGLGTRESQQN